ncbi:MAG TPA: hypothetical protein VF121_09250 [Thermoanaerobaculia bacterium]|nr:hypothetical protein [Thermoanaerobaculia bacterium]
MTDQKKLKRAVRARSAKTGESYTAARRQVLAARSKPTTVPDLPAAPPQPLAATVEKPAPARSPGSTSGALTDEAAREKTGHGLEHWFAVLDAFGAAEKGHTGAADHLYTVHGVPGWHALGITVAYERARGLRQVNQSCTGGFQVSVSKTVPVPVSEVVEALRDGKRRAAWTRDADPALAAALEAAFAGPKPREVKVKTSDYAWLRFPWDDHTVVIYIRGKASGASVVADNSDLPEPRLVEVRRAQWKAALEGLRRHLGGG